MDMQRNERTAPFTLIELLADDKVGGSSGAVHVMFPL